MDVTNELFTKALNIVEPWEIRGVEFDEAGRRLDVRLDFRRGSVFACPNCGRQSKAYDTVEKTWRHLNFFQHECYLVARVPRVECPDDGVLLAEVPWARKGTDFTLLFETLALLLCREMPINRVAGLLKTSGRKLWKMTGHYVDEALKQADYGGVKTLGVDETSMKKGHDYITIGVDIEGRRTVFVGKGKDSGMMVEMRRELEEHGCDADGVERLSIDMSPAFIKGAAENFPKAEVVFDRFHVMKVLGTAVDYVRKTESSTRKELRKTRYLWLKNRGNLSAAQREALEAIESMPRLNLKTVRAYHMRENFQEIYKETDKEGFVGKLKKWYFWATHSRISAMVEAARTIRRHWEGVVSWFDGRVSNGLLEGLNSLIQAAKAKARGYRTFRNFRTIVFLLTGKLDFSFAGLTHSK